MMLLVLWKLAVWQVRNVAMAGAVGAVIINNMEGGHLIAMGEDGQGDYPHAAAVLVDAAAGQQLSAAAEVQNHQQRYKFDMTKKSMQASA